MSQLTAQAGATSALTPTAASAAGAPQRGKSRRSREALVGWLFVTPFIIVVILFLAVPLGYALYSSLFTESLALGSHFSGLSNYTHTFTDPQFIDGVKRVALFGIVQIPIMMSLALLGALALDAITNRFAKIYRLIAFMPYAVPAVIGALMWGFLYSPTFGPFAGLGKTFGGSDFKFFGDHLLLASLGNVVTWSWTGYNMIVMYSALQGVSREMYEAALMDGATHVQVALRIKIPAIRRAIFLAVLFSVIGTMQFFTEPSIFARFAPQISAGYTPNIYAYNLAFKFSEFHYSAAISFTLGVVVFLVSYVFVFSSRRKDARG